MRERYRGVKLTRCVFMHRKFKYGTREGKSLNKRGEREGERWTPREREREKGDIRYETHQINMFGCMTLQEAKL